MNASLHHPPEHRSRGALAVVFVLATIYPLIRLAGRLYTQALLPTGARLNARAAWHATRQRRTTRSQRRPA